MYSFAALIHYSVSGVKYVFFEGGVPVFQAKRRLCTI
jgi:hypothetical protein